MADRLFDIELFKDGPRFLAVSRPAEGAKREYKNQNFEDLLTELLTDIQESIVE